MSSDQLAQAVEIVHRIRIERIGVNHRLAGVAQRVVDGVGEHMDRRRLVLAGNHGARATVLLQVLHDRSDPFCVRAAGHLAACGSVHAVGAYAGRNRGSERFDIDSAKRQPMIGLCAGRRSRALDHVQPVHGTVLAAYTTASCEIPGIPDAGRTRAQEIRIERKNHIRFVELVVSVERLAVTPAARRRAKRDGPQVHSDATWPSGTSAARRETGRPALATLWRR